MRQKMYIAIIYGVKNGEPRNFLNNSFATFDEDKARERVRLWFEQHCKEEEELGKRFQKKHHGLWYDAKITFDDSEDFTAIDIIEKETETVID